MIYPHVKCWLLAAWAMAGVAGCAPSSVKIEPVYFPAPPARAHVVHLKSFNRLGELVPVKRGWLESFREGAPFPHARSPAGLAYRDGCLYICDTGLNVVHRWDLSTGKAASFGRDGKPALIKPVDVAVDNAGTMYVADTGLARVVTFNANGAAGRRFQSAEREAYRPVAVAVRGSRLYAADIEAHCVDVFSTDDGEPSGSFGGIGGQPGRFFFPMGLAVTPDGGVGVADMMNARVQVFDARFEVVLSFGQPGDRYGDMGKPRRLAVGADGVIFVADMEFARVHLFDSRGRLLMLLGGPEEGPGSTPMPVDVAVARTVPENIAALVPADFKADYFLFVANRVAAKRLSLYAVGTGP